MTPFNWLKFSSVRHDGEGREGEEFNKKKGGKRWCVVTSTGRSQSRRRRPRCWRAPTDVASILKGSGEPNWRKHHGTWGPVSESGEKNTHTAWFSLSFSSCLLKIDVQKLQIHDLEAERCHFAPNSLVIHLNKASMHGKDIKYVTSQICSALHW